jgi:hypothetical protein
MVEMLVEDKAFGARTPLKTDFEQVLFRQHGILSADPGVIAVVRLNRDHNTILDMGFKNTLAGTTAITAAGGINGCFHRVAE